MEKARAAISNFTSKHGHQTDVEEVVRPAVVDEHVKPIRHEEVTQAVDREVHQHHHHTTVQPLEHREVLPEQHKHNMIPIEQREFRHDNESETKERLAREAAQFKDHSMTHETKVTQAAAPTVTGEHVHHHVHETVQPVIHKETIRPEVIHTTVPIHEVHHGATQHHGMSMLPVKKLEDFTSGGGSLTGGKSTTHEQYEGQPRPYNKDLQTKISDVMHPHRQEDGVGMGSSTTGRQGVGKTTGGVDDYEGRSSMGNNNSTGMTGTNTSGPHNSNFENKVDPRVDSDRDGRSGLGNTTGTSGTAGSTAYGNQGGNGFDRGDNLGNTDSRTSDTSSGKPSLASRLNPF